jgi:pSer/pThr/pTyr-binding forkhead associated (FHA) protein
MRVVISPIGELIIVGRESNATIQIDAIFAGWGTASPRRARLTRRGDRWIVTDSYNDNGPSGNGIYANRHRTRISYLKDKWIIGFGRVEFCFHASTAVAQNTIEKATLGRLP